MKILLSSTTVVFGIVAFVSALTISWRLGRRGNLSRLLGAAMGASAIPIGLVFIYCAFDPPALKEVSNAPIYVALAGLAVIFVGCRSFAEQASLEEYMRERSKQSGHLVDSEKSGDRKRIEMRTSEISEIVEPPAQADG